MLSSDAGELPRRKHTALYLMLVIYNWLTDDGLPWAETCRRAFV